MKKSRSFENKNIRKQYILLVIYNMVAFLIVYLGLGFFVVQVMNQSFFKDLEDELLECKETNEDRLLVQNNRVFAQVGNPRFLLIFYNENQEAIEGAYSDEIFNYLVEDYNFGDNRFNETKIQAAKESSIFDLNDMTNTINKFEKTVVGDNEFNFMTISFEINGANASTINYCKVLVMVNAEINTRNKIVNVYAIASAFIVFFGMVASILLSSRAIKPIADSLQKQLVFVGDASHELRTPLSIVQSKLENILTKTDASVVDVSEDIAISLKEVSRLSKLTSDLLVLAKSDNDNSNLDINEWNVKEIVGPTIDIFKEIAEIDNKIFTVQTEEFFAFVDKSKFVQVLIILLDNALKYTNNGESINVSLTSSSTDFVLEVSDTGIGINEETKKRIFERFYREDKARSRETGGNGLGLAIARTIVLEHGGKISVDHNQPKGTKFTVNIPCREKKKVKIKK